MPKIKNPWLVVYVFLIGAAAVNVIAAIDPEMSRQDRNQLERIGSAVIARGNMIRIEEDSSLRITQDDPRYGSYRFEDLNLLSESEMNILEVAKGDDETYVHIGLDVSPRSDLPSDFWIAMTDLRRVRVSLIDTHPLDDLKEYLKDSGIDFKDDIEESYMATLMADDCIRKNADGSCAIAKKGKRARRAGMTYCFAEVKSQLLALKLCPRYPPGGEAWQAYDVFQRTCGFKPLKISALPRSGDLLREFVNGDIKYGFKGGSHTATILLRPNAKFENGMDVRLIDLKYSLDTAWVLPAPTYPVAPKAPRKNEANYKNLLAEYKKAREVYRKEMNQIANSQQRMKFGSVSIMAKDRIVIRSDRDLSAVDDRLMAHPMSRQPPQDTVCVSTGGHTESCGPEGCGHVAVLIDQKRNIWKGAGNRGSPWLPFREPKGCVLPVKRANELDKVVAHGDYDDEPEEIESPSNENRPGFFDRIFGG